MNERIKLPHSNIMSKYGLKMHLDAWNWTEKAEETSTEQIIA